MCYNNSMNLENTEVFTLSILSQRAEQYVADHMDEVVSLTGELCSIPAPSHHEELRADFCLKWLKNHGIENAYIDDAKNVIWPYRCDGKNKIICVAAHTDTVFPDLTPFTMEIRDGRAYCPAVGDDTVNVAMLMLTMAYVAKYQPACESGFLFVLNACEEGLGNLDGMRRLFSDWEGRIAEFATLDGNYTSVCSRAVGSTRYRVTIETEGGHSFGQFGNRNSIEKMARLIGKLYDVEVPKIPGVTTTYNVGTISGGTSVNTIAQNAEMLYEYRSDAREGLSAMKRMFDAAIEFIRPQCKSIKVEILGERPCSGNVDPLAHQALITRFCDIAEAETGSRPATRSGSTDCNWPLSLGIPAICFGGYKGFGSHTREEYIELDSLPAGMRIVAAFILSYFEKDA